MLIVSRILGTSIKSLSRCWEIIFELWIQRVFSFSLIQGWLNSIFLYVLSFRIIAIYLLQGMLQPFFLLLFLVSNLLYHFLALVWLSCSSSGTSLRVNCTAHTLTASACVADALNICFAWSMCWYSTPLVFVRDLIGVRDTNILASIRSLETHQRSTSARPYCRLQPPPLACIAKLTCRSLLLLKVLIQLDFISIHILQILQPLLILQTLFSLGHHSPELLDLLHSTADHLMGLVQLLIDIPLLVSIIIILV